MHMDGLTETWTCVHLLNVVRVLRVHDISARVRKSATHSVTRCNWKAGRVGAARGLVA